MLERLEHSSADFTILYLKTNHKQAVYYSLDKNYND